MSTRSSSFGERVSPSQTAAFTATDAYGIWLCSGTFTVTLPTVGSVTSGTYGSELTFKNTGTGVITLDGSGSETIDGALTKAINGKETVSIHSDGTNWQIMSSGTVGQIPAANNNVSPGTTVMHVVTVPDGATADIDVVVAEKVEVIDVLIIKTTGAGGASDTITVKNTASAISNAISINIADQTTARAGTIDDSTSVISAGGTLRVTRTKASAANVACIVYVTCLKRA